MYTKYKIKSLIIQNKIRTNRKKTDILYVQSKADTHQKNFSIIQNTTVPRDN